MILGLAAMAVAMAAVVLSLTYPNLPSLEILTDYRPKVPLRVYTADGFLLGEFGEERRAVVSIQDVPVIMKQAILAAEDERFYQHGGVDTQGVLRALYAIGSPPAAKPTPPRCWSTSTPRSTTLPPARSMAASTTSGTASPAR